MLSRERNNALRQSTDRILVSHGGNLPRPDYLNELIEGGVTLEAAAGDEYHRRLPSAVQDVVEQQVLLGVDIVNDGEFAKAGSYGGYMIDRVTGYSTPPEDSAPPPKRAGTWSATGENSLGITILDFGPLAPAVLSVLGLPRRVGCAPPIREPHGYARQWLPTPAK